ncbi:hypothetical protein, partial [Plasmodium yoelii yoelii]
KKKKKIYIYNIYIYNRFIYLFINYKKQFLFVFHFGDILLYTCHIHFCLRIETNNLQTG